MVDKTGKIAVVVGTRGELIGTAPVIKEIQRRALDILFVHTGQHYDPPLYRNLLEDLELPEPKYSLGCGSRPYGEQIGFITERVEKILSREKPHVVLVQGNNNSTVGSAIACIGAGVQVGHVEAGVRHEYILGDTNRRIVERVASFCFAPFAVAAENLRREGVEPQRINLVGDTYYDGLLLYSKKIWDSKIMGTIEIESDNIITISVHTRPHRNEGFLRKLLMKLVALKELVFVWTTHPSIHKKVSMIHAQFKSSRRKNVVLLPSIRYTDFQRLLLNSKLVITDSGVTQEEAFLGSKPCIALVNEEVRNSPYPMLVKSGWIRVLNDLEDLPETIEFLLERDLGTAERSVFGDGKASSKILDIVSK